MNHDTESRLGEWVRSRPSSYAARLARGIYMVVDGCVQRGTRRAKDIAKDRWQGIYRSFDEARKELLGSLSLTARPLRSYLSLMTIEMVGGGQGAAPRIEEYYRRALETFPASMEARKKFLTTLRAEWGGDGTLDPMRRYLEDPIHGVLTENERRELLALRFHYEGHWFEHFADNSKQALAAFTKAIETFPESSHYWRRAALLCDQRRLPEARADMAKAQEISKGNDDKLSSLRARASLACALYDKNRWNKEAKSLLEEIRAQDKEGDVAKMVEEHVSGGFVLWLVAKALRPFMRNV